ncbi:hypothetical protein AMBAS45_07530 [Alteromonas macleodii str. 'Balearic Sea AD45']|nr:hypothetical protein AMBAS45_07530 [Alteromonas macleodii str. 'Balearic Sea AD45']
MSTKHLQPSTKTIQSAVFAEDSAFTNLPSSLIKVYGSMKKLMSVAHTKLKLPDYPSFNIA